MKKLLSIFLAGLMLMASTGITLATHYCGGYAVESEIMLGQHMLGCVMQMDTGCSSSKDQQVVKPVNNCCDNDYQTVSADNTVLTKVALDAVNLQFLAAFTYTFLAIQPDYSLVEIHKTNDPPPLLDQDIHILNQSFLL
ncbi:HYC_CC_PP family protein [Fulvivirga sediminis]|uniref:Secreted protein n=1 Tax=Fulvivirga sediminis TaxID=2803949 RepID=A0A937F7Z4_9BACT|nr:hypothetical protein [Fulvivirga sediminis]MBL3656279.1 hypothetical protein [Fulvivirga sediminis]